MGQIVGAYSFRIGPIGAWISIKCTLRYASWLVDSGRTHGGIFNSPPLKVFM